MNVLPLLRAAARDEHIVNDGLVSVAPRLRELRSHARRLTASVVDTRRPPSAGDAAEFLELVRGVWASLASLPHSHTAALPPLYPTEAMVQGLRFASGAMLAAECGQRLAASANAIYSGVRGTGKSTLLRAVGACAAVLLERVLPVIHSYEVTGVAMAAAPSELIACALEEFYVSAGIPERVAAAAAAVRHAGDAGLAPLQGLAALHAAGHTPLLLLDEFAVLYPQPGGDGVTASDAAAVARGITIMTAVHTLCKMGFDVVALLATSRTDVHGLIHPNTTAALLPARRVLGYPNLNNQVFIPRTVRPIRDTEQLARYVQARHGEALPLATSGAADTSRTAADVLHATGGCGRLVAQLIVDRAVAASVSTDDIVLDPPLFATCCALLSYAPPGLPAAGPWPLWSMPLQEAVDVARAATASDANDRDADEARARINDWRDQAIFYINERGALEPLVPALFADLQARVAAASSLSRARVLVQTLQGFDGGTAGHSNEALLCEGLATTLELRHVTGDDGLLLLSGVAGSDVITARLGESAAAPLTAIDGALNTLLRWRVNGHETGIDRLWLRRDAGTRAIQVGLLQLKTGSMKARLTAGRLETQRAKSNASTIDDTTVAGIHAKAERGVGELLRALAGAFPTETFQLDRVYLFTTKAAQPAATAFCNAHPLEADELRITLPVADQMRRLRAAVAAGADDIVVLRWSVTDGLEWVRDVLPATISSLLM